MQWLINVMFTVVGQPLSRWVSQVIEQRNAKITLSRKLLIDLDPEIASAFNSSTSVSGKSCQLKKALYNDLSNDKLRCSQQG